MHPIDPGSHWLEAGITGLARQREWDAVATADAWQGNGIARTMLAKLERSAAAAGIHRLVGETMRDNARLMRLARGIGFKVSHDREDASLMRLEKPVPAA